MSVQVLYFDDCPNHESLLPHLRELLCSSGVHEDVELVRVADDDAAQRERFLGSPTVRIDGRDIEPGARLVGTSGSSAACTQPQPGCAASRQTSGCSTR